jgi:hypothetical protein
MWGGGVKNYEKLHLWTTPKLKKGVSYLYPVRIIVEQKNSGSGNFLRLDHRLQVGQQTHMLRHVRCQNLEKMFGIKPVSRHWQSFYFELFI